MRIKSHKKRKITLVDIAKASGVSAITVSRALRAPEMVSKELRERIQRTVDDFGYLPDPAARALASARTNVIGVLIPSLTNSVFAEVIRGIYATLGPSSTYDLQLGNTRYSILEEERLLRVFLNQRPAGLIVAGIDQSATARDLLLTADCPVVQIMETGDSPIDMVVGFSHRDAAWAAVQHLLDRGYRRIAFLGAQMDPRTQRRLEGYSQCLRKEGLFDPTLIVTTPKPSTVTLGCELLSELLARTSNADAIFCNNDDLAMGVLFECQRRQIHVPDRMGICGFNDLEMVAVAAPSITSVRTYRERMGITAIEMLVATIEGRKVDPPVVDLGYELIPRQSTSWMK